MFRYLKVKNRMFFVTIAVLTLAICGIGTAGDGAPAPSIVYPGFKCVRNVPDWLYSIDNQCALTHSCIQIKTSTGSSCSVVSTGVCTSTTYDLEWYIRSGICKTDDLGYWYCDTGSSSWSVGGTTPVLTCTDSGSSR